MQDGTGNQATAHQMDFTHLLEPPERVQSAQKRSATSDGTAKPREARLRKHSLADTVPSRTPAQRRQLVAAMELLNCADDVADCHVEVLTLGEEVLWDYERYEIALELGLNIRTIPIKGNDPTVRLCLEALHAPQLNAGLRALIAVVACKWAGPGRPPKPTLGVTFRDIPWTIEEMATLARVGTTRISEAKQICAFQLEDMVLARDIAFGEAFKMASLVRAAGLSKRVHDGALTLDQAYKKALAEAESVGADQERDAVATANAAAPNQPDTLPAAPVSWKEEKAALQERIRELTAENTRMKHELQVAEQELDEERALRMVAQEAMQDMKLRLEDLGFYT